MPEDDRRRGMMRLYNKARAAALKRLVELRRADYDRLYAEEANKVGVVPSPRRRGKIDQLRAALEQLEGDDDGDPERQSGGG